MPAAVFATAGNVLTAAEYNALPRGRMGHAEDTSNRGPFTGAADYTGLTVTFTGVAGRMYRAIATVPECTQNVAAGQGQIQIVDGSSNIYNRAAFAAAIAQSFTLTATAIFTLTGSGTVKCRMLTSAGNLTTTGSATLRAVLLVEDIGSAT